jgi:hypothetical protein
VQTGLNRGFALRQVLGGLGRAFEFLRAQLTVFLNRNGGPDQYAALCPELQRSNTDVLTLYRGGGDCFLQFGLPNNT